MILQKKRNNVNFAGTNNDNHMTMTMNENYQAPRSEWMELDMERQFTTSDGNNPGGGIDDPTSGGSD